PIYSSINILLLSRPHRTTLFPYTTLFRSWHKEIELPGNARMLMRRAGHILGAATLQIDIAGKRIVFSGDLGRYRDPVMHDPEPVTEADYIVVESTYGNRRHDAADPQ